MTGPAATARGHSDSKFIDSFLVVLGILVLIAVAIYFLAASMATRTEGMDTLVTHAIEGFQGQAGYMPPRGGQPNLSDEQVRDAVQFMVDEIGN